MIVDLVKDRFPLNLAESCKIKVAKLHSIKEQKYVISTSKRGQITDLKCPMLGFKLRYLEKLRTDFNEIWHEGVKIQIANQS